MGKKGKARKFEELPRTYKRKFHPYALSHTAKVHELDPIPYNDAPEEAVRTTPFTSAQTTVHGAQV
jgi:hypothetical protein